MKITIEEILVLKELTEKARLAEREDFRLLLLKALKVISELENNNFSTDDISMFTTHGGTKITIKLFVPNVVSEGVQERSSQQSPRL